MTHINCKVHVSAPSSQLHLCYKSKGFRGLFYFKISEE